MAQTDIAMTDASAPDVCMYNYVVTAHKSDAVFRSVVGNFTASDARNLIIAYVVDMLVVVLVFIRGCLVRLFFPMVSSQEIYTHRDLQGCRRRVAGV